MMIARPLIMNVEFDVTGCGDWPIDGVWSILEMLRADLIFAWGLSKEASEHAVMARARFGAEEGYGFFFFVLSLAGNPR